MENNLPTPRTPPTASPASPASFTSISPLSSFPSQISHPRQENHSVNKSDMSSTIQRGYYMPSESKASPALADAPGTSRRSTELASGVKGTHDEVELSAVDTSRKRAKSILPPDYNIKIGVHRKWSNVPLFVRYDKRGGLIVFACKTECEGWGSKEWIAAAFPSKIHILDVVFQGEICDGYSGDLQLASLDVKRNVFRDYAHNKLAAQPSNKLVKVIESTEELHVGTHTKYNVKVYASLKGSSDSVTFRVHPHEILPLELPKAGVRAEDIDFNVQFGFGNIESIKSKIKGLLARPSIRESDLEHSEIGGTNGFLETEALNDVEEDTLANATKVAETAFEGLRNALAKRAEDLVALNEIVVSNQERIEAKTNTLRQREKALKVREEAFAAKEQQAQLVQKELTDRSMKLKNDELLLKEKQNRPYVRPSISNGSIKKLSGSLTQHQFELQNQEEFGAKDKDMASEASRNSWKARQQWLDDREEDLNRRQTEVDALLAKSRTQHLILSTSADQKLKSLRIPVEQTFDQAFKKLSNKNPNPGMLRERESQLITMLDTPFKGTRFTATQMLSEVPDINVDGQPTGGKFVTAEGSTYSVYSKDGVTKLVRDLDRDSLVEYEGKTYIVRKLLKEIVEDDTF